MSGDHNQYQRDEENVSYMYTLPENGALRISVPLPDPQITWGHSNTSEIWARVDKDGNVTHLDMELCAKGPHNAYTALAMAIWKKAIETEREKVAAWMMRQGYATGHGDTIEELLQELDWQIKEKQEPVTFVCSTGLCRLTLTQTGVGIGERGMQAYEEAKKRGWVGISDERLMDTDLLRKCLDALEYEAQRGNDDAYRELRDALKERLK